MIGEILSVLGIGYSYVGGIHQNRSFERIFENQRELTDKVEKLSDNIMYQPSRLEVEDRSKHIQEIVRDLKIIRAILEPLQKTTGNKILSSAAIPTPYKMKDALCKNPWEVLDSIRPIQHAISHSNPDMVPVLFEEGSITYIGWQMRGTLPILFGCNYNPEGGFDIMSDEATLSQNTNSKNLFGESETPITQQKKIKAKKEAIKDVNDKKTSSQLWQETERKIHLRKKDLVPKPETLEQIEKGKYHFRNRDFDMSYELLSNSELEKYLDDDAKIYLGFMYQTGRGCTKNYSLSAKYLEQVEERKINFFFLSVSEILYPKK